MQTAKKVNAVAPSALMPVATDVLSIVPIALISVMMVNRKMTKPRAKID